MPSSPSKNSQVYVAGYSRRTNQDDLEDLFKKFGKIRNVVLKERYAFIEFEDHRDADDAVNEMNGYDFEGRKLVVEPSGKKSSRRTKGPQAEDKCFKCGKTGHWANECREQGTRDGERREKKCYNCGESGHIKKFCPKQRDSRSRGRSSSSSSSRSRSESRHKKSKRDRRRSPSSESRSRSRSRDKSESRSKHRKDHRRKD